MEEREAPLPRKVGRHARPDGSSGALEGLPGRSLTLLPVLLGMQRALVGDPSLDLGVPAIESPRVGESMHSSHAFIARTPRTH